MIRLRLLQNLGLALTREAKLLGEADALQLAGCSLRNFGEDHHMAWYLEVGHAPGGEVADLARRGRMPVTQNDCCGNLLAQLGVRNGEGHHLRNGRVVPSGRRRLRAG